LFLAAPQNVAIVYSLKNYHDRLLKMTPNEIWAFLGVAKKRDLSFITITICELHVALAWDIRVIPLREQIDPSVSWKWTGLWFWS
jgi:hypothetical protein